MNIASVFSGIATVAWVIAVAVIIILVVQAVRSRPIRNTPMIVTILVVGAIILSTVSAGLVFINPDERGVVISAVYPGGYRPEALQPGLRWIIPFAESVVPYSIAKQNYTMSSTTSEGQIPGDDSIECRTSDGQKVNIDASVIFSVDPAKVVNVHINWKNSYADGLVRSISRGVIRDSVAQFKVEEVYSTKRNEMTNMMSEQLGKILSDNGFILSNFILRNVTFSPEYAASIEQKQIAEQQAEQAKFIVEQKKQEADQLRETAKGKKDAAISEAEGQAQARLLQAEAEAKALQMINDVIAKNPNLITYLYVTKLSPNIQVMLLPSNSPFLYTLPDMQTVELPTQQPTQQPTESVSPTEIPTLSPTPTPGS